jgi:hypothetical protein
MFLIRFPVAERIMDQHDDQHSLPTAFGRGWIPAERSIGLPGEAGPQSPLPHAGGAGGGPVAMPPGEAPRPVRHTAWTAERKLRFLDCMAEHGNVRAACARVAVSPETAYKLRRREPLFAAAWEAALVLAREHAEQVLGTRAIDGTEEEVYYRGELVGCRRRYDTRLLLAHLARLDRRAEAPFAQARAARFDELLALVAGHAPPPELCGEGEDAGEDNDGAERADPLLPLAREAFVDKAGWRAAEAAREAVADDPEEGDEQAGEEVEEAAEEEESEAYREWLAEHEAAAAAWQAAEDAAAAAAEVARDAAAAQWDGWAECAWAAVDALAVGPGGDAEGALVEEAAEPVAGADECAAGEGAPLEYKALRGRPGPCAQDPVHCVHRASPGAAQSADASGQYCVPIPSNTRLANFQPSGVRRSVSA